MPVLNKIDYNFDVIANPNNPDELYIVKNGSFVAGIREPNKVALYKEGANFPNLADVSIYFDRSNPLVIVADNKHMYFDVNLDGVDAIYEKYWHEGTDYYLNYVDLFGTLPRYKKLVKADRANQQCEKVVGPFACCLNQDQTYQPYSFNSETGW